VAWRAPGEEVVSLRNAISDPFDLLAIGQADDGLLP